MCVITSYSIHYTKLYDVSLHLRDLGNATEVSIVHKDWPTPMTDSVRHEMAKHYHGWKTCLARLKHYAHHYGEAAD